MEAHPLNCAWSFWEHRANKKGQTDYEANMHELGSFNTVEGFWQYHHHIPKPSEIFFDGKRKKQFVDRGAIEGFSVFKKGIKPEWEDPANRTGGEWYCRTGSVQPKQLDAFWQHMLMSMVGETLDSGDEVTGARVVDKSKKGTKMYRIELWFRSQKVSSREELYKNLLATLQESSQGSTRMPDFQFRSHC